MDLSNLTDSGKQQVKDLSAWNVVANGNTAEKVEGGNTVKFIDGDNISITQNGKDFTIATKQDVTFQYCKSKSNNYRTKRWKLQRGRETPQWLAWLIKEWISGPNTTCKRSCSSQKINLWNKLIIKSSRN